MKCMLKSSRRYSWWKLGRWNSSSGYTIIRGLLSNEGFHQALPRQVWSTAISISFPLLPLQRLLVGTILHLSENRQPGCTRGSINIPPYMFPEKCPSRRDGDIQFAHKRWDQHLGCRLEPSLHPKLSSQKSPAPASVASLDINNTAVHHKATGDPHEWRLNNAHIN